jgi:hypothetical protein
MVLSLLTPELGNGDGWDGDPPHFQVGWEMGQVIVTIVTL